MKNKIKIELPTGETIERVPTHDTMGNFSFMIITHDNKKYVVNNGDEYLRGYPDVFRLRFEVNGERDSKGHIKYIKYKES